MAKKTTPHPDAHMLVDPIDHEAATTRATRYFDDFNKVAQHSKSDVNLMRCYLALVKEAKELSDEVIRLRKVEKTLNTVAIPKTEGRKSNIDLKVDFSCTHGADEPTPCFTFRDANSGVMVMEARLSYESFGQLMTGLGHRPAKASIWDNFKIFGLHSQTKTVIVKRPESLGEKDRTEEMKKIIAESCAEDLADGWFVFSDGCRSQQHDERGWKITLARYVKVKPKPEPLDL